MRCCYTKCIKEAEFKIFNPRRLDDITFSCKDHVEDMADLNDLVVELK